MEAVAGGRFTSHLGGALGAFLTASVARRWGALPRGQHLAGLGLAFSSGYWLAAADAETYALLGATASLVSMTQYAERPTAGHGAAPALANSIAVRFQLQLLSLTTASLCLIASGWSRDRARARREAGVYLACLVLAIGVPYLLVSVVALQHRHPLEAFRRLVSASVRRWQEDPE